MVAYGMCERLHPDKVLELDAADAAAMRIARKAGRSGLEGPPMQRAQGLTACAHPDAVVGRPHNEGEESLGREGPP